MTDATVWYFTAPWCAPCKAVSPIVEAAVKEMGIGLARVNIDDEPELAQSMGVMSVPAIFISPNSDAPPVGAVQVSTPRSKVALIRLIAEALA